MLCVHFPEGPAGTLVLGSELIVLFSIYNAIAGHKLYVYLHLLSGILGALIRFVLPLFPFLCLRLKQLSRCFLKAAITAMVAVFTRVLIA